MEKPMDGSAQEASPSPSGSQEDFVRDGDRYTWVKPGTPCRRVKLHNRRVLVGYTGDKWYLYFKSLVSVKDRQISTTKLALSREAGAALYMLIASFIHPQLESLVTSASESAQAQPEPSQSPPVTSPLPPRRTAMSNLTMKPCELCGEKIPWDGDPNPRCVPNCEANRAPAAAPLGAAEALRTELAKVIDLCTVEGLIPADEDGPNRIGYMVGRKDDGKSGLYVTPKEAFSKAFPNLAAPSAVPVADKPEADVEKALANPHYTLAAMAMEIRAFSDTNQPVPPMLLSVWAAMAKRAALSPTKTVPDPHEMWLVRYPYFPGRCYAYPTEASAREMHSDMEPTRYVPAVPVDPAPRGPGEAKAQLEIAAGALREIQGDHESRYNAIALLHVRKAIDALSDPFTPTYSSAGLTQDQIDAIATAISEFRAWDETDEPTMPVELCDALHGLIEAFPEATHRQERR